MLLGTHIVDYRLLFVGICWYSSVFVNICHYLLLFVIICSYLCLLVHICFTFAFIYACLLGFAVICFVFLLFVIICYLFSCSHLLVFVIFVDVFITHPCTRAKKDQQHWMTLTYLMESTGRSSVKATSASSSYCCTSSRNEGTISASAERGSMLHARNSANWFRVS